MNPRNMTPLNTRLPSPWNNDSSHKNGVSQSGRSLLLPPISPHSHNPLTRFPAGSLHLNPEKQPMLQQPDFSSLESSSLPPKIPSLEGSSKHHRSVSMDGCFNPVMPASSLQRDQNNSSVKIGDHEYTEYELKMMASCSRLSEMASDPKKVRKTLANRERVERSRQRKLAAFSDLENTEKKLAYENPSRSIQFGEMKKNQTILMDENKELRIRFTSMEQQEKFDDALIVQLHREVERLKREMIQSSFQLDRSNMQMQDPNMFQHHVNINQFNQDLTNPDLFRNM